MAVDRRLRKTETAIQDAFISLSSENGPDSFKLADVIERSDLNKSTFYLHYQSLNSVSYALEDSLVAYLLDSYHGSTGTQEERFLAFVNSMSKKKKAILAVLGTTNSHFYNKLFEAFKNDIVSSFKENLDKETMEFKTGILFGGLYGILRRWISLTTRSDKQKLAKLMSEFVSFNAK